MFQPPVGWRPLEAQTLLVSTSSTLSTLDVTQNHAIFNFFVFGETMTPPSQPVSWSARDPLKPKPCYFQPFQHCQLEGVAQNPAIVVSSSLLGNHDTPAPQPASQPVSQRPLEAQNLVFFGLPWPALVFSGLPWSSLVFPCIPWSVLVFPGLSWSSLVFFGLPWSSLVCHGLPWSSLVCPDLL